MRWPALLLLLSPLAACPEPEPPLPPYPWQALRPAIAERLPSSSYAPVERACGFDPGPEVLVMDEQGGALGAFFDARAPAHYQARLAVFRPSWFRPVDGELAGWLFVIDGASLVPACQAPLEARVSAQRGLAEDWLRALDDARARLSAPAAAP